LRQHFDPRHRGLTAHHKAQQQLALGIGLEPAESAHHDAGAAAHFWQIEAAQQHFAIAEEVEDMRNRGRSPRAPDNGSFRFRRNSKWGTIVPPEW
jgi:hypothetical protein